MRERFGTLHALATSGALDNWAQAPLGRLALILLLDQMSRHIHRGTTLAFAGDAKAQHLVTQGLQDGMDRSLSPGQRQFFYMPLMHAEDRALQALSITCFTALRDEAENTLSFARKHSEDIARFRHFPCRNAALGRVSSHEEQAEVAQAENASS